jgi:hypothetical protein
VQGQNIFGFSIPDGAYFTVSDRRERDITIARQKHPNLGEVQSAVVDHKLVGNPFIRASVIEARR